MLRKDKPLQVSVKIPSIHTRPESGLAKTASTGPAPQTKANTSTLQKLLFQKLDDYDTLVRKQKKQEKLDKKTRMSSLSGKSQQSKTSAEQKNGLMIEDVRQKAKRTLAQKNTHSLREIKIQQKQKSEQTFITRASENRPKQVQQPQSEEFLNSLTGEQVSKLYAECKLDEHKLEDYKVQYTPTEQIRGMIDDMKKYEEQMDEVEGDMNALIRMVGYASIPKDVEENTIEEEEGN